MKEETKVMIQAHLTLLQETLKEEKVALGIQVDKQDNSKSKICFIDYGMYENTGEVKGFTIDLKEFNGHLGI